jgi:hypothetical protein
MSAVGLASPALAAGGDIIILREVQPRSATREPLIPDPNPHVVNPKPNAIIDRALRGMVMPPELSDSDFAAVTGSYGLPQQGGVYSAGVHGRAAFQVKERRRTTVFLARFRIRR